MSWQIVDRNWIGPLLQIVAYRQMSIGLALAVILKGSSSFPLPACTELTDASRTRLTAYVAKLVKAPADTSLELLSAEPEDDTCFRRLEFKSSKAQRLTLFLSPDQRFLTPQLFDSLVDPMVAEQKANEHTKALIDEYIEKNRPPILGPVSAPITIAVFSDFQCPFCRRAMNIVETEVLPKVNARLAYIDFPLSIHPWATQAAQDASCIARESTDAFWPVHDYVFEHQGEITAESIDDIIVAQAQGYTKAVINIDNIKQCVRKRETTQKVQADTDFGNSLGITVTPTLFINGKRVVGVPNAKQLLDIVEGLKTTRISLSGLHGH